jgi:hypothetical protein
MKTMICNMKTTEPLQVRLRTDVKYKLRQIAEYERTKMSEMIQRLILDRYRELKKEEPEFLQLITKEKSEANSEPLQVPVVKNGMEKE